MLERRPERRDRVIRTPEPTGFRRREPRDLQRDPILVEQTAVVDPQRHGRSAGRLDAHELRAVDEALGLILGL